MATIKSYTDLEQSKKLAEILPLESADMRYAPFGDTHPWVWNEVKLLEKGSVPCWSLAALLGVLPNYEINNFGDGTQLSVNNKALVTENDETLLDLVVNMIIYLHELKML